MREICRHCKNRYKPICRECVWEDAYPSQYRGRKLNDLRPMIRLTTSRRLYYPHRAGDIILDYCSGDMHDHRIRLRKWKHEQESYDSIPEETKKNALNESKANPFVYVIGRSRSPPALISRCPPISDWVVDCITSTYYEDQKDQSDVLYKKGELIITAPWYQPILGFRICFKGYPYYAIYPLQFNDHRIHLGWLISASKDDISQLAKRLRDHQRSLLHEGTYPCKTCGTTIRYSRHNDTVECLLCQVHDRGRVWDVPDNEWEVLE